MSEKIVKIRRKAMDVLEKNMLKLPQIQLEVKDFFTDGLYVRTLFIPAGVTLTTEIHKAEHVYFLNKGKLKVLNIETNEFYLLHAPHTGITKPMTRRLIYAFEDSLWTTVHPNPKGYQTVDELAKDILIERKHVTPQYKLQRKEIKQ